MVWRLHNNPGLDIVTTFYGQGNPVMEIAFRDFVSWAWEDPATRAAFEADTGMKLPKPATTGLDRLIDEATGHYEEVVEAFTRWVIANVWGESGCSSTGEER